MGCALLGYFLWLSLRPVEIVAVHKAGESSSVLVKNFPVIDQEKISWWLNNKEMLKDKYKMPEPASDELFSITFWDFGDGYKEEGKYDRRCFDDIKIKFNCIDKNRALSVDNNKNNDTWFTVHDGIYQIKKDGEIIN